MEWRGSVWMNPPYSQPLIQEFMLKLIAERNARHVSAAIALTHNYTDSAWFQDAAAFVDAICFPRSRVKFLKDDGEEANPTQGQAFHYFGSERGKFAKVFGSIGFVLVRS
jgi:ParB family chromosome partitioning protein